MANLPQKILVADNDEVLLNQLEHGLAAQKITVVKAKNWENALYLFNNNKIDLAVVELELQGLPGTVLVQKWRNHEMQAKRDIPFIISSGRQRKAEDDALIAELEDVPIINKPITAPVLLGIMAAALKKNTLRVQLSEINQKVLSPLLKAQKYEKAVEIGKAQLEPLGPSGKFQSAILHDLAKKPEDALHLLTLLSQDDPKNLRYINEIGRINLGLGRLDAAKAAFEKADKAAPFNLSRMQEMARMYLKMNLPEETLKKFEQILSVSPDQPDMKFDMYEELLKAGFEEHAVAFCKKTSTPKELVRHFNNKGVLLAKETAYEKALEEYQKAMRLVPGSKEVYRILYNMAISHINLKSQPHIQEAHRLLEECIKLSPDYEKAKEKLALTEKYLGSAKGAST